MCSPLSLPPVTTTKVAEPQRHTTAQELGDIAPGSSAAAVRSASAPSTLNS